MTLLDSVMPRLQVYEKTVVSKTKYFKEDYSDINTLEKLIDAIERDRPENFAPKYLNYRFKQLVQALLDTLIMFNDNSLGADDLESMRLFA